MTGKTASDPAPPAPTPVEQIAQRQSDLQLMLSHALLRAGVHLDADTIKGIDEVTSVPAASLTADQRARLWTLLDLMAGKIAPATLESIYFAHFGAHVEQPRPPAARIRFVKIWLVCAALLVLPVQIYTTLGASTLRDVESIQKQIDDVERQIAVLEDANPSLRSMSEALRDPLRRRLAAPAPDAQASADAGRGRDNAGVAAFRRLHDDLQQHYLRIDEARTILAALDVRSWGESSGDPVSRAVDQIFDAVGRWFSRQFGPNTQPEMAADDIALGPDWDVVRKNESFEELRNRVLRLEAEYELRGSAVMRLGKAQAAGPVAESAQKELDRANRAMEAMDRRLGMLRDRLARGPVPNLRAERLARLGIEFAANFILPVLFGLIGVCVSILRELQDAARSFRLNRDFFDFTGTRMLLGAIFGALISFFLLPTNVIEKSGLTLVAVAFVSGFSVDLTFELIQGVVNRLRAAVSAWSAPPKAKPE